MNQLKYFKTATFEKLQNDAHSYISSTKTTTDEQINELLECYNMGLHTKNECFHQILDVLIKSTESDATEDSSVMYEINKRCYEIEGEIFTFEEIVKENPDLEFEIFNRIIHMEIGETFGEGLNISTIKRLS